MNGLSYGASASVVGGQGKLLIIKAFVQVLQIGQCSIGSIDDIPRSVIAVVDTQAILFRRMAHGLPEPTNAGERKSTGIQSGPNYRQQGQFCRQALFLDLRKNMRKVELHPGRKTGPICRMPLQPTYFLLYTFLGDAVVLTAYRL